MSMSELHQSETWTDGDGVTRPISEMTASHRHNLRAWLLRNAASLKAREELSLLSFASVLGGEMAVDEADRQLTILMDTDAEEWIRETPLFEALEALDLPPVFHVEVWLIHKGERVQIVRTEIVDGQTHEIPILYISYAHRGHVRVEGQLKFHQLGWSHLLGHLR